MSSNQIKKAELEARLAGQVHSRTMVELDILKLEEKISISKTTLISIIEEIGKTEKELAILGGGDK